MISPAQIRAARAMLDWSQDELADRIKLTKHSVSKIERGDMQGSNQTLYAIQTVFELAGLLFTETGVELSQHKITILNGDKWFNQILEDAYFTLSKAPYDDKEILMIAGDDELSPPFVIDTIQRVRQAGIRLRVITRDQNRILYGQMHEYRWLPQTHYLNCPVVIFGHKVALTHDYENFGEGRGIVIESARLAQSQRGVFKTLWSYLPEPDYSESVFRYP